MWTHWAEEGGVCVCVCEREEEEEDRGEVTYQSAHITMSKCPSNAVISVSQSHLNTLQQGNTHAHTPPQKTPLFRGEAYKL